jgi:tripartite-type tricarboxylate transporter receptor subunit TctC
MNCIAVLLRPKAALIALAWIGWVAGADVASGDTPYFAGKTITIHVGFAAGGAAANETLAISKHLAKHIPGNPGIIVDYMPGAGTRILANYMYNVAGPSGLEIGRISNAMPNDNLVKEPTVKFEAEKFYWIGSFVTFKWLMHSRTDSGFTSLESMKGSKKAQLGANGPTHYSYTLAKYMVKALGLNLNVLVGYPGGNDITLAIERGEIDGVVNGYPGFMQRNYERYKAGQFSVLVQSGRDAAHEPLEGLESVPVIWKLVPQNMIPLLQLVSIPWDFPYVMSPNTPPEIVETVRKGFEGLSRDAEFAADYQKSAGDTADFTPGKVMQEDVKAIMKSTPETIRALQALIGTR